MIKNDLQNGRSMIEMLGVLAIIGVLTVGGFSLITKANNSYRANTVIDEISGLASKVRIVARDADDGSFGDFIHTAKAYPDTLSYSGGTFTGATDATYTVAKAAYPALFTITAGSLSEEMCMTLATANWGSQNSSGFMGMTVSGAAVSTTDDTALQTAAANCSEDNNTIVLTFR